MMRYKVALLVGRFQPFHNGHLYLLHKALEHAEKIIIGIGSANLHDKKNPMDFEIRKQMLEKVIGNEVIGNKVLKIVPLDDIFDDQKWFDNTVKQAGKFDLVIGDNEWVNHIFEERGYKILRIGFYKRYILEGEKIRELMDKGGKWQERVPKYSVSLCDDFMVKKNNEIMKQWNHGILGGTFDHFHVGHIKLIDEAICHSKKLTIGIVKSSKLLDKNFSNSIEPYQKRLKSLSTYVEQRHESTQIELLPINDIYGPTLIDANLDVIFVTEETKKNAIKINKERVQKGWKTLKIVEITYVKSTDGKIISSERIRSGEIDREGYVYSNLLSKTLYLPDNLRESLRKPLGNVYTTTQEILRYIDRSIHSLIIAVGDIIAQSMIDARRVPDISVIDFKSRRQKIPNTKYPLRQSFSEASQILNKPGTINYKFATIFQKAVNSFMKSNKKQLIIVDGEEDLLTLPAILLAPLGSLLLYGQFDLGVVVVEITEEKKNKIKKIIKAFDSF